MRATTPTRVRVKSGNKMRRSKISPAKPPKLNLKGAAKVVQLTLNYQRTDWRPVDVINVDVLDYSASILSTGQAVYS